MMTIMKEEIVMIINFPQYPLIALFALTLKPQFFEMVYKTQDDLTPASLPTFLSHGSPTTLSQPTAHKPLYFS